MPGPCEPRNPPFQGTRSRISCKLSMTGKLELMNETPSGRRPTTTLRRTIIRDKTILAYYDDDSILSSNLMTRYFLPTNFYIYLYISGLYTGAFWRVCLHFRLFANWSMDNNNNNNNNRQVRWSPSYIYWWWWYITHHRSRRRFKRHRCRMNHTRIRAY